MGRRTVLDHGGDGEKVFFCLELSLSVIFVTDIVNRFQTDSMLRL